MDEALVVGSIWWQWTAPRDGLLSLAGGILVFTGSSLENLVPFNEGRSATRMLVNAGTTYQLASSRRNFPSNDEVTLKLSMKQMPNDDFANRATIPSELPFNWRGTLPNATFQAFESTLRDDSAWWQWTAPRDGTIEFDSESSEWSIYRLAPSIVELFRVASYSTSTTTIQVLQDETYVIQITGQSFVEGDFQIDWQAPAAPPQIMANATVIEMPPPVVEAPPSYPRGRYYQWIASKSGTLAITSDGEPISYPRLFSGADLQNLSLVAAQDNRDFHRFPIVAGKHYWIFVRSSSIGETEWTPVFGPADDNFANAPSLPSNATVIWQGNTTGAGLEMGELFLNFVSPGRTVWRKWTSPKTGSYRFEVEPFDAGIFQGTQVDGLRILAEGDDGIFTAIEGITYHFVVNATSREETFQFTLAPNTSPYETWRVANFGENITPGSEPNADPDRDGRTNLIELALGSDPRAFDQALPLSVIAQNGTLTLNLIHPENIEATDLSFEISRDLENWQPATDLEHESQTTSLGNGQESFQVTLLNIPGDSYYVRLKVRIDSGNP